MLACFISILSFHAGPAVCHRNRAAAVRACAASEEEPGVRVNKALRATHSRREADRLVDEGRVSINGAIATSGDRLARGDVVHLDGSPVDWERLNPPTDAAASDAVDRRFVYLKYWKPRGIVCTTDRRQRDNILDAIGRVPGVTDRIYPIGRLDADSTGLILLTSDGEIVNGLLRASQRKSKDYVVSTHPRASDAQVARLAAGVTITTVAQRDGRAKPLTAPTLPCVVERGEGLTSLRFVLQEGRNRQIRRMCAASLLRAVLLHLARRRRRRAPPPAHRHGPRRRPASCA
eukprot:Transcript_17324.p3 GENE.Transcript_17324~~Transcript_17324.p3  ORF type:complete len:311 (-),score=83.99 Transcript_17324:364-1233(-)